MKLSIWSNYFNELTPEKRIEIFSQCGYNYLEFSTEDGEILLERGNPEKVGAEYKKHLDNYGVDALQGHLLIQANILNSAHISALKTWLDLFNVVGVKNCVLHYGIGESVKITPETLYQKRVSALTELTDYIKDTDMVICLENLITHYDKDSSLLLNLVNGVNSKRIGICLDTGHLNLNGGDPSKFVLDAGNHLKALHIADNEGFYDQHLMPYGKGNVPWESFMRTLNNSNYNGLFNMEIPGESRVPLEIKILKAQYIKRVSDYMFQIK